MNSVAKDQWCTCTELDGTRGMYPPKSGTGRSLDGMRVAEPKSFFSEVGPLILLCVVLGGVSIYLNNSLREFFWGKKNE